jgi:hypothetical protein
LISREEEDALVRCIHNFGIFLSSIHQLDLAFAILSIIRVSDADVNLLKFRLYWAQSNPSGISPNDPFHAISKMYEVHASQCTDKVIANRDASKNGKDFNRDEKIFKIGKNHSKPQNDFTIKSALKQASTPYNVNRKLAKYQRDGFITSVGNMQLAAKYGNRDATISAASDTSTITGIDTTKTTSTGVSNILNSLKDLSISLEGLQLRGILAKKKYDVGRARDAILEKSTKQTLSPEICDRLIEISSFISHQNYRDALQIVQVLTSRNWSEHKDWLKPLKSSLNLCIRVLL